MAGVLEGLRVVAMEHMEAIPASTLWMADWGAEVLKIEPLTGDMFRGTARAHGTSTAIQLDHGEVKWAFQLLNRNKKSLAVDLKKDSGSTILYKLIQVADVFVSNYELDTLKKLRVDYATLSQINPKLIYAVISGYGSVGPDKNQRGFDHAAGWARTGMQYLIGEPGQPPPRLRGGMIDRGVAAPHALAGILAALLHREKTGKGQELEVSLFHSGVWTIAIDIQAALVGTPMSKDDRAKAQNPIYNVYRTKDNRWIQMSMLQSDVSWPAFCQAIERPALENDSRFNSLEKRTQNCEELVRIIDEVLSSKNMEEWDKRFREYDLIYAPVQSPTEVTIDPQALANDFFVELPYYAGELKVVTTPVKFHQNPASVRAPAPEVGQHTEEVLLELGYTWEEIARLKEQGVIL